MKRTLPNLLPEFPHTPYLAWKAHGQQVVASLQECAVIFAGNAFSQEKVDGANCGMALVDGHPVIRSRSKILRKGGLTGTRLGTNPAMAQFAGAFNWFYRNVSNFKRLSELLGPVTVYGEWMVQQHGMFYDNLPDWFLPFDVYDQESTRYYDPRIAYDALTQSGFCAVGIDDGFDSWEALELLANKKSDYSSDLLREGVYVKVSDGKWVTHRFKMVREGFDQGCLLSDVIKKNKLRF